MREHEHITNPPDEVYWCSAPASDEVRPGRSSSDAVPVDVFYRGRLAAVVSDIARLEPHIEGLPKGDADRQIVRVMIAHACAVVDGELPGPFDSAEAEVLARRELTSTELSAS